MRQWIWRHMMAAAAGVFVLASLASAQQPGTPSLLPAIPQAPAGAIAPIPARAVNPSPVAAASTRVAPVSGSIQAPSQPGSARNFVMSGGGYCSKCQLAQPRCSSGCGSFHSDVSFVFGSCKSYFNACGPNKGCGRNRCPGAGVYGTGGTGYNGCIYDSYLNH